MEVPLDSSIGPVPIVLLAAGAASRFGGDKLNQTVHGKRLIDWAVGAALESQVGPVWVVVRPGRLFDGLPVGVRQVENAAWQGGLSTSVRAGAAAVSEMHLCGGELEKRGSQEDATTRSTRGDHVRDAGGQSRNSGAEAFYPAAIFAPADQPTTVPEVYRRLVAHYHDQSPVVVAAYSGAARNPVLLGRQRWLMIDHLVGDRGLRDLVRDAGATFIECGDLCENIDIDTPNDLLKLVNF